MKLRNKKTGEIKEVIVGGYPASGKTKMWECSEMDTNEETGYKSLGTYNSLAELNEEWEDYEEPKDFWYIDVECGVMCDSTNPDLQDKRYPMEFMKAIGNYFETREEAEQAVEKLKAWKRLKDKGFEFTGFEHIGRKGWVKGRINFLIPQENLNEDDLDLLFGGEDGD